ncbi:hypothetical protein ACHAXR_006908 [Thalassiosira sp. AJA248-18]
MILPQTTTTKQRRQQLYASSSSSPSLPPRKINSDETDRRLINLAKKFITNKNSAGSGESTLDGIFDMCSTTIDLYGLKGDDVRPGFSSFFQNHEGLHHELLDEPSVVGLGIVQYPFVKRWRVSSGSEEEDEGGGDNTNNTIGGEDKVWKSIDPAKPRNKVERLWFDAEGKLEKVSVVGADDPLD